MNLNQAQSQFAADMPKTMSRRQEGEQGLGNFMVLGQEHALGTTDGCLAQESARNVSFTGRSFKIDNEKVADVLDHTGTLKDSDLRLRKPILFPSENNFLKEKFGMGEYNVDAGSERAKIGSQDNHSKCSNDSIETSQYDKNGSDKRNSVPLRFPERIPTLVDLENTFAPQINLPDSAEATDCNYMRRVSPQGKAGMSEEPIEELEAPQIEIPQDPGVHIETGSDTSTLFKNLGQPNSGEPEATDFQVNLLRKREDVTIERSASSGKSMSEIGSPDRGVNLNLGGFSESLPKVNRIDTGQGIEPKIRDSTESVIARNRLMSELSVARGYEPSIPYVSMLGTPIPVDGAVSYRKGFLEVAAGNAEPENQEGIVTIRQDIAVINRSTERPSAVLHPEPLADGDRRNDLSKLNMDDALYSGESRAEIEAHTHRSIFTPTTTASLKGDSYIGALRTFLATVQGAPVQEDAGSSGVGSVSVNIESISDQFEIRFNAERREAIDLLSRYQAQLEADLRKNGLENFSIQYFEKNADKDQRWQEMQQNAFQDSGDDACTPAPVSRPMPVETGLNRLI